MLITKDAQTQLDNVLDSSECLEISLKGGGCGGATIVMDKVARSPDSLSIHGAANVVFADDASMTHLTGGTLDYNSKAFNASFTLTPPKGTDSCGCGSSIKIG